MADQKQEQVIVTGTPVTPVVNEATKRFRLKPGFDHTHGTQPISAGDEIELTEAQSHAFADRFEPVDDSKFEVKEGSTATVHKAEPAVAEPSHEAVQAQEDKRKAEAKYAEKMGAGVSGEVKTVDSTKGTLKSDPDGTASKL